MFPVDSWSQRALGTNTAGISTARTFLAMDNSMGWVLVSLKNQRGRSGVSCVARCWRESTLVHPAHGIASGEQFCCYIFYCVVLYMLIVSACGGCCACSLGICPGLVFG